jgi:serine/threonine protein kinase
MDLPNEPSAVTLVDTKAAANDTESITAVRQIPDLVAPPPPPAPAPTPRPTLPPGARRLGRFIAEGPVARGPSGPVFRSRDDNDGRDVHIETMPSDLDLVTATAAIAQLAKLEHVNLVRVFELVVHAGRAYLVREPLTGRSLFQHVKERKTLPWLEAVGVGDQLCAGLELLHERSIFHRAIRPAWIVVEKKTIKLGGMAIAAGIHDRAWIAPEVIAGGEPDPRSDIYGVGAILYHCLTGEPPGSSPMVHQGPKELQSLVAAMLAKAPADRPASVTGLRNSFKELFEV